MYFRWLKKNHEKLIRNCSIRFSRNLPGSIAVNVIHRSNGINWGTMKHVFLALKLHEFETSVKKKKKKTHFDY